MKAPLKPDVARSARQFGCTIEQAKALLARNAQSFAEMALRAERTGQRVNGYSAAELRQSEHLYREASR